MAVVVERADMERFMDYCREENIEVTHVADVTDTRRMRMYNRDRLVVDLSREFIDSAGAAHYAEAEIGAVEACDPFVRKPQGATLAERMEADLADDNVVSQKGLVEMFDSTIGASTVLLPFGGRTQGSETQVSVQKLPVDGYTETASIMAYGYNPFLTSWSPYHGAAYAVVEACAKAVAAGAEFGGMRFSYQEYFERMHTARSWGKPLAALLGALRMQVELGLPSIGGKDSMSGTFQQINVPPMLMAFGITTVDARRVISTDLKEAGHTLYLLKHTPKANRMPDTAALRTLWNYASERIAAGRDRGGLCRRVRRCGRGAGEDGFRQRNRRGGRVAGGGAVRLRLRFDRGGEHRRTRRALRRAAGPDDGRRSVDRQRRADAARHAAPRQQRALRPNLSRPRREPRNGHGEHTRTPHVRLRGRGGGAPRGLPARLPGHELRLRHGPRLPPRRRRGRDDGLLQPFGRGDLPLDPRDEGAYPPVPHLRAQRRILVGRRTRRKRQVHRQRTQQQGYRGGDPCAARPRRPDPGHLQRVPGARQVGTAALRAAGLRDEGFAHALPQRHQPPRFADRYHARGFDGFAVAQFVLGGRSAQHRRQPRRGQVRRSASSWRAGCSSAGR